MKKSDLLKFKKEKNEINKVDSIRKNESPIVQNIITFFLSLNEWNKIEFDSMIPERDINSHIVSFVVYLIYSLQFIQENDDKNLPKVQIKKDINNFKKNIYVNKEMGLISHCPIFTDPIQVFSKEICFSFDMIEVKNCFFGVCQPDIKVNTCCFLQNKAWSLQAQGPFDDLPGTESDHEEGLYLWNSRKRQYHIYQELLEGSYDSFKGKIENGDTVTIKLIKLEIDKNEVNVEFFVNKVKMCGFDEVPLPLCLMIAPLFTHESEFECNYYLDVNFRELVLRPTEGSYFSSC
jgi:hypothetical protein